MDRSNKSDPGMTLDEAVNELQTLTEDALDFKASELEEQWATAEKYYNGFTDLVEFEGRSNVTKTEVRDAVRNTMPSIMRTLLHSRKIVQYFPSSVEHAAWIEQQAEFVTQLFYKSDGYSQTFMAVQENLKKKLGPMKVYRVDDPQPRFFKYTAVPINVVEALIADPLIDVEDFNPSETQLGERSNVELYDVTGVKHEENGKTVIEATPNYEFFISRNCTTIEQALRMGVHGQHQLITVSEAIDMGLDYDGDWLDLDAEDPEQRDHTSSSAERKGYQKDSPNDPSSADVLRHQFTLTEAYFQTDLEGTGRPQTYVFYLAGTAYEYLHHEQVEDSPFALINAIPIEFNAYGHSIPDLTITEQDTSTSLLRASVDNAHAANGAKIYADPQKTNFDDMANTAINAPVRSKTGAQVQVVQVPFTAQGTMGILQYLDQDIQNKVGITKAAQGLDPDAMQSTDKNAVMNTIATSQGQTELMVRNIIETGLIRVFKLLMRLSVRHQSPMQLMVTKGKVIPVDQRMFDPDAVAIPNVGLGTGSPQQKQAALTMVYAEQKQYMEQFGPNNPFTSFAQMYNTLEDMLEANGVYNVERYFNIVTPQVEQKWAQEQEKKQQALMQQQQENQPIDPSKAFMQVEEQKRELDKMKLLAAARDNERDSSLKAITVSEQNDLERDRLVQNRVIELAKINQKASEAEDKKILAEQQANDSRKQLPAGSNSGGSKSEGKS